MTNFSDISADPLYLTALASLGAGVPVKLMAAPSNNSIAVLPFVDMSGEVGHEHFTDGLTEDIITDLSNVNGFFVIARNSVFAYKGKPTDVRQIAHDLGVKYILEGSARRAGQRLRINVQLIDASEGGNHVWAERFDRELADIFEVQDEVSRRVVEAITGRLQAIPGLERNRPKNLKAYDLVVLSRYLWHVSKSGNDEAKANLQEALSLEPDYAEAHSMMAFVLYRGWSTWDELPDTLSLQRQEALYHAERAVQIDPKNSWAHGALAYLLVFEKRWEEAKLHFDESLRLSPNNADCLMFSCDYHVFNRKPQDAVEAGAKALRLNPQPPAWYYWALGFAQVANRDFENAVVTLRREGTYRSASRRVLAAALALLGQIREAKEEGQRFLTTNPHWRIGQWVDGQPFRSDEDAQFWIEAYRLAGLPE